MTKDGVKSKKTAEEPDSWAECNDCMWYKHFLTSKQARSAARYHSVSTSHTSVAVIQRSLQYTKVKTNGSN